ncbi:hypothetical protein [Edaphobacter aggregans]|uniref:hypothetical protein n=1 Tax=Edaphobacter aggregans TaxID=570835 RepID=UPI0005509D87|nr:hypothetical protein [Edaphobacter aggregans]
MTVHYLFAYGRPEQGIVGALPDKRMGYSLTLQTSVLTKDGKPVYEQNERLAGVVNESQTVAARSKRFGAESRVPLAPGEYQLVATLTNDLNHLAVRQRTEITVPDPAQTAFALSRIMIFSPQPPVRDPDGGLPFSVSGLRFVPKGVQQTSLHPGEPLRLLFQLWTKPFDPATREGRKVKVHYVYGTMQTGQQTHQEDEEIDAANFDASGTLLTGRTLSTEGLAMGNYRVVITAIDETTQQKAYANLTFRIAADTETTDVWTAYEATADARRGRAIDDYKRGLSAEMQGSTDGAITWFERSVADDPRYVPALTRLVDLLAQSGRSKDIAALSGKVEMTHRGEPADGDPAVAGERTGRGLSAGGEDSRVRDAVPATQPRTVPCAG